MPWTAPPIPEGSRPPNIRRLALLAGLLPLLLVAPPAAPRDMQGGTGGWVVEPNEAADGAPAFAVARPQATNVNVDAIALTCVMVGERTGLEIELHVPPPGPLLPVGATADQLRQVPQAEIAIDGVRFPAQLMFSDDFAVLVDQSVGRAPMLSEPLLQAMQQGRRMVIRLDLLEESQGVAGQIVIDLQAGRGGAAVAEVRRCAGLSPDEHVTR